MALRLSGQTSGYVELEAPAVAGDNTVTLPTSNGAANQVLKNGATAGQLEYGLTLPSGSGSAHQVLKNSATPGTLEYGVALPSGNGTSGQYLQTAGDGTTSWATVASIPSLALISDSKAANTFGGTFTSGAWRTRDLNTEDYDSDGIVSISSNQFTLGAGTYTLHASAPAFDVDEHIARIANITDTIYYYGQTLYAGDGTLQNNHSQVWANLVITASKVFELQHRCKITQTSSGFGLAANLGVDERYSVIEIIKWA